MKHLMVALLTLVAGSKIAAQEPVLEKALLWKISGKDLQQPSYLFGTIHVICADDIIVDTLLQENFNKTNQLFLELDLDSMTALTGVMQELLMEDTTLKDLLDQETYDTVSANFEGLTQIPFIFVNRVKPMMAMSMVYPSILGCKPEAWEQRFTEMAHANNIPVLGLETLEQQIAVLDSIPLKEQAEMLAHSLKDLDSLKYSVQKMLTLYKEKDINALYEQTGNDDDFIKYEGVLLQNRNKAWIEKIIEEASQKPTFFAFGAGHLAGSNGIINMLREKGYTVSPVE